mmetsp:Transcript_18587/g.27261  ORF Transcript_18587/g.27261 Transcript_18587/m.27261 type:complete len:381 (+) Transcript_18587:70-1212(+)
MASVTLIFVLFCVLNKINPTSSFASWFVETELACYTYMEAGEIVMNNAILPATNSRNPEVYLQIYREDKTLLNKDISTSVIPFSADGETLKIRLFAPPSLKDLQFAAEVSKGATFTRPHVGCEGRRASAGKKTEVLTLELSGEEEEVHVLAGWATGHEAVSLTPKITLKREGSQPDEETAEVAGEAKPSSKDNIIEAAAPVANIDTEGSIPKDNSIEVAAPEVKSDLEGAHVKSPDEKKDSEEQQQTEPQSEEDISARQKAIARETLAAERQSRYFSARDNARKERRHFDHHRHEKMRQIHRKDRRQRPAKPRSEPSEDYIKEPISKIQKIKKMYDRDNFGSASFSMEHFVYCCIFYALIAVAFFSFRTYSVRKREKRNL